MSRTVCIVQARMASSRLPNKVLLPLGGRPTLAHVLARCAAIPSVAAVCCATVDSPDCDPVADLAAGCGVHVFRGAEGDVLGRYRRAAEMLNADVILRVTSDCPLIDPEVCEATIQRRMATGAAYASNNRVASWPHGLDCEAFTMAALRLADEKATLPEDREHVTYWITERSGLPVAHLAGPGGAAPDHRWTLDYPEDYDFLQRLFALLPPWPALPSWREVADILAKHPEIVEINSARRLNAGHGQAEEQAS